MENDLASKWESYKKAMLGLVPQTQTAEDDDDLAYKQLLTQLPTELSQQLVAGNTPKIDWSKQLVHSWCLCDMPEGEFPRVHIYKDLGQLVEAIAKREGQTTAVWPMYGIPLRLSKPFTRQKDGAICRYMLLPNQQAILIAPNEPVKLLHQAELTTELEVEEDGWLGDQLHLKSQSYFIPGIEDDQCSADPDNEIDPDTASEDDEELEAD